MINIEDRKLKYILCESNTTLDEVNKHFQEIDEKMNKIKIGSKLFQYGSWDDYYELTVVNIVDKESGIVAVKELGYSGHEDEIRNENVYYLDLKRIR